MPIWLDLLIFFVVMSLIVLGLALRQVNKIGDQKMLDDFPFDPEVQRKYAPRAGRPVPKFAQRENEED